MKRALLIFAFLILSCSKEEIPIQQTEQTEVVSKDFLPYLIGKWQLEPDNSYREIYITEPNLFSAGGYPSTIEPVSATEAKVIPFENNIQFSLYFKITKHPETHKIWVYRWHDTSKELYSKSSYTRVKD